MNEEPIKLDIQKENLVKFRNKHGMTSNGVVKGISEDGETITVSLYFYGAYREMDISRDKVLAIVRNRVQRKD